MLEALIVCSATKRHAFGVCQLGDEGNRIAAPRRFTRNRRAKSLPVLATALQRLTKRLHLRFEVIRGHWGLSA